MTTPTTPEITGRILFLSSLSHGDKLKELLATIHRDGGHFANEHGLATAVAEAEAQKAAQRRHPTSTSFACAPCST